MKCEDDNGDDNCKYQCTLGIIGGSSLSDILNLNSWLLLNYNDIDLCLKKIIIIFVKMKDTTYSLRLYRVHCLQSYSNHKSPHSTTANQSESTCTSDQFNLWYSVSCRLSANIYYRPPNLRTVYGCFTGNIWNSMKGGYILRNVACT